MSDVIGIVLKMILGLFVKKARSSLSDKLKDGGLNSQQLRNLIVSKLQNVERKLGGLARANLLTSVSRIQEGLRLLGDLLDKPSTPTLPLHEDADKGEENSARPSNTGQASSSKRKSPLDVDSTLKLVEVIDELKRNSGEHFTSAIELFKEANTKATEAFHNEALSLEDRILAAKLRVQSRLLLSLDNPSLANQSCRLYLEELHGLAPIVKDFRRYLEGGMASVFNKEERRELVLSVSAVNLVVFKFLKSFTKGPVNLYDWPNITSDDWTYNPLIPDKTINVELQNAEFENSNLFVLEEISSNLSFGYMNNCVVNSEGNFIAVRVRVKSKTNKVQVYPITIQRGTDLHWCGLTIDSSDIAYFLYIPKLSPTLSLTPETISLKVIDSKRFSNKRRHSAELDEGYYSWHGLMVNATPDGFAVVSKNHKDTHKVIFYKNNQGNVKRTHSFEISLWVSSLTTVTNMYQLVAAEDDGYHVRVYEKDGQLIQEFELYEGKRESCVSIAFNNLTEELVCVSHVGSWFYLSTYKLDTGVRRHKARLTLFGECSKSDRKYCVHPRLTAHCNGLWSWFLKNTHYTFSNVSSMLVTKTRNRKTFTIGNNQIAVPNLVFLKTVFKININILSKPVLDKMNFLQMKTLA